MDTFPFIGIGRISKTFRPAPALRRMLLRPWDRPAPVRALADVSLDVERGRAVALLGPNGAGKTTLLKICATLILPDAGLVTIDGLRVGRDDERIKQRLGLVTCQERSFYWRLTGRENLLFFAALQGLDRTRARRRVEELCALFDVRYADRRFDTYSAGMKQRFSLMRGLLADPGLLLLDEPFQSLDFASAIQLRTFCRDVLVQKEGKTLLFATHQVGEAADLCTRFVILNEGRLRASGTLDDVRAAAAAPAATLAEAYLKLTAPQTLPPERVERIPRQACAAGTGTDRTADKDPFRTRSAVAKALAFLKKDFLVESSYKLAFLFNAFSVLANVLVYYFIDKLFGNRLAPHLEAFGASYFSYVLLGLAFFSYAGTGLGSFAHRLRAEQVGGTLEAVLVTPTPPATLLLSLCLWNFCVATFDLLVYLALGAFLFHIGFGNVNLPAALLVFFLTAVSFSGLGILSASFILVLKRGNPVSWVVSTLEGLLGGVYFPVSVLPGWLQAVSRCLPITYAIRAIQLSVYKGYGIGQLTSEIGVLLAFSLLLAPLGLFVFRSALTRSRVNGSLAQY
ncbi:MAG: ABC transporter ATP-binding protein/permease [Deltaproteobacteria bacterium]